MPEPTEEDAQRRRADELRAQIEDLRRGIRDPAQPESPREFTDDAADEAAARAASESGDFPPDEAAACAAPESGDFPPDEAGHA